eukprot:549745-Pyramimonas_sp.AAC.3
MMCYLVIVITPCYLGGEEIIVASPRSPSIASAVIHDRWWYIVSVVVVKGEKLFSSDKMA